MKATIRQAITLWAALLLCAVADMAFADKATPRRPREIRATGNRDIITLKHGARFTGVIVRERKKSIDFLVVAESGTIHQARVPLARIKRIERLTTKARKAARTKIEAAQKEQRKASRKKLARPRKTSAVNGYFIGTWSNPYCQSFRHVGFNPHDHGLGPPHFLTPAGWYYMMKWL